MGASAHFKAKRFAEQPLERLRVAPGGPQLQLGIAGRPNLKQLVLAAVVEVDARNGLRVAAVEALREPQDCGQRHDDAAASAR